MGFSVWSHHLGGTGRGGVFVGGMGVSFELDRRLTLLDLGTDDIHGVPRQSYGNVECRSAQRRTISFGTREGMALPRPAVCGTRWPGTGGGGRDGLAMCGCRKAMVLEACLSPNRPVEITSAV